MIKPIPTPRRTDQPPRSGRLNQVGSTGFPIVCVGGSAGGLQAYIRLLRHLPDDMGVAIVIVNHLRTVATMLPEIMPHYTAMKVSLITEAMPVLPDCVYIIPEKRDLHVRDGAFHLEPISKPRGWPNVITVCLVSLTRHWPGQLIAVIVSGYDGDGAAALCGIRDAGGIAIAQAPDTAEIPDMPASAIASGCVDFILSPEAIAQKIVSIARHAGHPVGRRKCLAGAVPTLTLRDEIENWVNEGGAGNDVKS
jgi:chemotaxis response regulator CheB